MSVDLISNHLTIFPFAIHHSATLNFQSVEIAIFPCSGQSWKHLHLAIMALEEHLGDTSGAAKVAINLERRMGTKQIGISSRSHITSGITSGLKQLFQEQIGMVAIAQTSPETNLPCARPTRAFITTTFQGLTAGFHQLGSFVFGDAVTRIKAEKMRNMTMLRLHFRVILKPFHQVAFFTYLHRRKTQLGGLQRIGKSMVKVKN